MILSFLKVPPQPHAVLTTAEVAKWLQISERSVRSEEHTSELQSQSNLVCRLLLEKKTINWDFRLNRAPDTGDRDRADTLRPLPAPAPARGRRALTRLA